MSTNPQGTRPDPKRPARKATPSPVSAAAVRRQVQGGIDRDDRAFANPPRKQKVSDPQDPYKG
jgi:hypothetical protein